MKFLFTTVPLTQIALPFLLLQSFHKTHWVVAIQFFCLLFQFTHISKGFDEEKELCKHNNQETVCAGCGEVLATN